MQDMTNEEVLNRRVANVLPNRDGLLDLMNKKKIRLYQGFDPTGQHLHLGHSVGIRKLMDFANAGHEVIFLFGTGTVLAGGGDPSDRDTGRKMITQEEIDNNIRDWKKQVSPLVDWDKVTIKQNGDWLVPLTLKEVLDIAGYVSAIQLFKRDMFQRRIENGDSVTVAETLYPLLQGYDSVAMDVDLEIGGTDQEFNMLVGRELMKKMKNKEKYVLTTPMILGTDGKQMSKTRGNAVWLDDSADDMFGKLMGLPDDQIVTYLELVTDLPMERVSKIEEALKRDEMHPLEAKKELGRAVVTQFHGEEKAQEAQSNFEKVVQRKEAPDEIPQISLTTPTSLIDLLMQENLVSSKSEARRLISQKGIKVNGEIIDDPNLQIEKECTLQVGPRKFLKLKV